MLKLTPGVNLTNIYEQLLCRYSFAKKLQSQAVIKEKLSKALLNKKSQA